MGGGGDISEMVYLSLKGNSPRKKLRSLRNYNPRNLLSTLSAQCLPSGGFASTTCWDLLDPLVLQVVKTEYSFYKLYWKLREQCQVLCSPAESLFLWNSQSIHLLGNWTIRHQQKKKKHFLCKNYTEKSHPGILYECCFGCIQNNGRNWLNTEIQEPCL